VPARAPRRTGSARCPAPRCARGVRPAPRVKPACWQRLRQRGSGRAQVALCALAGARVRHGRVAERGRAARRGRARPGPPPAPARLPGAAPPAPAPPVHAPELPAGGRALGPSAGVCSLAARPVGVGPGAAACARAPRLLRAGAQCRALRAAGGSLHERNWCRSCVGLTRRAVRQRSGQCRARAVSRSACTCALGCVTLRG